MKSNQISKPNVKSQATVKRNRRGNDIGPYQGGVLEHPVKLLRWLLPENQRSSVHLLEGLRSVQPRECQWRHQRAPSNQAEKVNLLRMHCRFIVLPKPSTKYRQSKFHINFRNKSTLSGRSKETKEETDQIGPYQSQFISSLLSSNSKRRRTFWRKKSPLPFFLPWLIFGTVCGTLRKKIELQYKQKSIERMIKRTKWVRKYRYFWQKVS